MKVLFADDDPSLRTALQIILTNAGHEVCAVVDGQRAVEAFDREAPDIVILDMMMPVLDGVEACRLLRRRSQLVPVLFLTAKGDITDKRQGFGEGADDYLTKPFDPEELLLHIEALLRKVRLAGRSDTAAPLSPATPRRLRLGDLAVDLEHRFVAVADRPVSLTPLEYNILALLAERPGKTYSRDEIAKRVWGNQYSGREVSIPTHIRHLREKIEDEPGMPRYLKTVGRLGYRLGDEGCMSLA